MIISDNAYLAKVSKVISRAQQVDVAVAFWGAGAEKLFADTNVNVRIICNLASGGTNPRPIRLLKRRKNIEVRQCSVLHAKLLLTDRDIIIGSANFSTNGLHYESGELEGWKELGIFSEDPKVLYSANEWFERLWKESKNITKNDLELADVSWKKARRYRTILKDKRAPNTLPNKSELLDRKIFLVVWGEDASSEAGRQLEQIKYEQKNKRPDAAELDFWEDWSDLPKDASLIDIYIGSGKILRVGKVYRRVNELDGEFVCRNGERGSIQVVCPEDVDRELPFKFDRAFQKTLRLRLSDPTVRKNINIGNIVPLADIV